MYNFILNCTIIKFFIIYLSIFVIAQFRRYIMPLLYTKYISYSNKLYLKRLLILFHREEYLFFPESICYPKKIQIFSFFFSACGIWIVGIELYQHVSWKYYILELIFWRTKQSWSDQFELCHSRVVLLSC